MELSIKQKHIRRHRERQCGCRGGGAWWREGLGAWEEQTQTTEYRSDKQQDPTVQHRELDSVSSDKP